MSSMDLAWCNKCQSYTQHGTPGCLSCGTVTYSTSVSPKVNTSLEHWHCANCGAPNNANYNYCPGCGIFINKDFYG